MIPWEDLELIINALKTTLKDRDYIAARNCLVKAVPGYKPKKDIQDPMYLR